MFYVALVVVLLSIPVGLFGLICTIKPLLPPAAPKRRVGAAIMAGSFVAFFGAAIVGGLNVPPELAANVEKTKKEEEGARGAAAAQPQAAVKSAAAEAMTQMEFSIVWGSAITVMERCNVPVRAAAEAVGKGDQYAAYPLVRRAQTVCEDTEARLRRVDLPKSAKGEVKSAMEKARQACARAAGIKAEAMSMVSVVVNGDMRPSAVADARAANERGELANLACAAAFAVAAETAGLELVTPDKVKLE